jgi:hypothetical protein
MANEISRNGNVSDPNSAAIRVDGNSQAQVRGGVISQNAGPAILALVNSSADFSGVTFNGNTGGTIVCDSTATMVSDLPASQSTPASGVTCKSPHAPVSRPAPRITTATADVARHKAMQQDYRKAMTGTALNAPKQ